jgi:phage protein D
MTGGPGTVISLSRARKARARAARKAEADANALRFGRTSGERAADEARADKTARSLEGHRREPAPAPDPAPDPASPTALIPDAPGDP